MAIPHGHMSLDHRNEYRARTVDRRHKTNQHNTRLIDSNTKVVVHFIRSAHSPAGKMQKRTAQCTIQSNGFPSFDWVPKPSEFTVATIFHVFIKLRKFEIYPNCINCPSIMSCMRAVVCRWNRKNRAQFNVRVIREGCDLCASASSCPDGRSACGAVHSGVA